MTLKHKILFLAFFIALVPALNAQFAPAKFVHLDTLSAGATNCHYLDWDGDGDTDILFTAERDFLNLMLVWMEGDGAGHFSSPRVWEAVVYPEFFLGDMNGDGSPDLVFRPENSQNIFWRANLNGVPGALVPISTNSDFIVGIMDWDGDGDNDVVEHGRWIENAGLGFFVNYHPIVTQNFYYGPIADMNADGRLDILCSPATGTLQLLRQDMDGAFVDSVIIDQLPYFIDRIFALDIDMDSDLDVLVYYMDALNRKTCSWYTNNGTGLFGPRMEIFDPAVQSLVAQLIAPVDVDSDGLPDISCSMYDTVEQRSYIAWFHNLGSGQFDLQTTDLIDNNGFVQVLDITGDGAKDILFNNGALMVAVNLGNNTYAETASIYPHAAGAISISAVDADTDGDLDLCFIAGLTGDVGWWPNDGAGNFGAPLLFDRVYESYAYIAPTPFSCADLNGDGWNDFILHTGFSAYVWLATGAGQFAAPDTFPMSDPLLSHPQLADADDDGDLDVVGANQDTSIWYPNDGNGVFGPVIGNIPASYDDASDCYGDLDGDGDRDLLIRVLHFNNLYQTQAIYWRSTLGNGLYGPDQLIVHFPAPTYFYGGIPACARDMDADGDLDVAVGISWYENDGTGEGWLAHNAGGSIGPDQYPNDYLQYHDFDNDGDVDVFSTFLDGSSLDRNWVNMALNDGAGNFSNGYSALLPPPTANIKIYSRDLDHDGDLDILFHRKGVVGWLENVASVPPILTHAFFDENGNGVQDSVDAPLPGVGMRLDPGAIVAFTDEQGLARFFVDTGFYQITYLPDDCRLLSTDSAIYHVETPYPGPARAFGFRPDSTQIGIEARLSSAPTRCGFVVPFWAAVSNTGCIPKPATFELRLGALAGLVAANLQPDAIQGDTLTWLWTDPLLPGETRYVYLELQMPGADYIGETLQLTGLAWPTDIPDLVDTLVFGSVINCAYDPNDKLVNLPVVPTDYDPATSELVYTIRFQNTGTDTAFTVVVRDTLDAMLDWNTFRPLGASHPFEAGLNLNTGTAAFQFQHILLPDSNVNERASHGYAQFAIRLKSGLEPDTKVFNTAAIYFDFNPPILTNAVETKVQAPVSVSPGPGPEWPVSILPNPNKGDFILEIPEPATPDMAFRILNLSGRLILEKQMTTGSMRQPVQAGALPAGLYFLQVVSAGRVLAVEKIMKL